jgi:hypothetical protein
MSKKLNTSAITNELTEGSAFFQYNKPQPPKTQTDALPTPPPAIIKPMKQEGNVASKKDSTFASMLANKDVIEAIRKAVKHSGKDVTYVRLTKSEKKELGDIIYTYKNQGIRTSENEVGRIGLSYLIADYKANGQKSVLAQVIKALND